MGTTGKTLTDSEVYQHLMNCGFKAPQPAPFRKNDPRGSDYGYYEASIDDGPTRHGCKGIRVSKRTETGVQEWSCVFDGALSFANWARDNT